MSVHAKPTSNNRLNVLVGFTALTAITFAPATAFAQEGQSATFTASPLNNIDPWGVGWLGQADGAMPATLWANTDVKTLQPILESLDPKNLSPAGRNALKRILQSSARGPSGEDEDTQNLIPLRLSLLEQLGDTNHANDLRARFPNTPWGQDGEQNKAAFALLDDQTRGTCANIAAQNATSPAWMTTRALCYAIAEDFDAATLLSEQAASYDPETASWMLSAIGYMSNASQRPPTGRYDTALQAAISVQAGLSAPKQTIASDLAYAILRSPSATYAQKQAVAYDALKHSRTTPADIQTLIQSSLEETNAPREHNALRTALAASQNTDVTDFDKLSAIAKAFDAVKTQDDFTYTSFALHHALNTLLTSADTQQHAQTFTLAALTTNDTPLAQKWNAQVQSSDTWAQARHDLILDFSGNRVRETVETLEMLIANSPLAENATRSSSNAARKKFDERRAETIRYLFLAVGTGRTLPPTGRTLLAQQRTSGSPLPDPALLRVQAANDAGAQGEAALSALALLSENTSAISYAGLADLLTQLRRTGLNTDADALALEAMQMWRDF